MTLQVAPKWRAFIQRQLASGRYATVEEVFADALRLLDRRERVRRAEIAKLRAEIMVGVRQVRRGQYRDYDSPALRGRLDGMLKAANRRTAKKRAKA